MHISRDPDELQPLIQGFVKVVGTGFVFKETVEKTA
jgi:hypothetical protein